MGGQNVVGLTEIGGKYFEEYFSVDWENYISTCEKDVLERFSPLMCAARR